MVVAVLCGYAGHGAPCPYAYWNDSSDIAAGGVRRIVARNVHDAMAETTARLDDLPGFCYKSPRVRANMV